MRKPYCEWTDEQKAKANERNRRWRLTHPPTAAQIKARQKYNKDYRLANCDQLQKYEREYRSKPEIRERRIAGARKWRLNNPAKKFINTARMVARRKGFRFNITEADLLPLPTRCPILGTQLTYNGGPRTNKTASIDRINNTKGYVRGNVHIISWRANILKHDATLQELRALANWINERDLKACS